MESFYSYFIFTDQDVKKQIWANFKLKKCQTSEIFSFLLVPCNLKIQTDDDVKFKNKYIKTI